MSKPIRVGLLRLVDSAPVIVAEAGGVFRAQGHGEIFAPNALDRPIHLHRPHRSDRHPLGGPNFGAAGNEGDPGNGGPGGGLLIEAGLPASTPAVAVENASRPNETHVHATLATLADQLDAHNPDGPTMVLIDTVVALSRVQQEPARLAT
ncbi:MAG TPA: hypothetical protein DDZ81_07530 [Acetobacteraceae bacterium]|nr:hypothetical protein [Acetobacteraceae bacterium]